jgi:hypothetical protein
MRNSLLASQGVFGPVVPPRQLKAGERVLFEVEPQAAYGPDGESVPGCARTAAFHDTGPSADSAGIAGGLGGAGGLPLAAIAVAGVAAAAERRRRGRALTRAR